MMMIRFIIYFNILIRIQIQCFLIYQQHSFMPGMKHQRVFFSGSRLLAKLSKQNKLNDYDNNNLEEPIYRKGFGTNQISKVEKVKKNLSQDEIKLSSASKILFNITKDGQGDIALSFFPTLNLNFPNISCIHHDPPIFEIPNFFASSLCDDYILRAQENGLQIASQTFSKDNSAKRTSTTWFLKYEDTPEFIYYAYKLTGKPIETYEEPQVVRYEMGQQFSWHYDAIPKSQIDSSGQRIATLLVYLNDVNSGGATCFKDLNLQIKPKKGKALLFFPSQFNGQSDERTMHSGQVVIDTKYIAQMWIHERDYTPAVPKGTNHAGGVDAMKMLGFTI